ncbi:alpha/beta hydrolase [Phytobacter sp. V91]|uniref:alpha/beta hydrolase n=1 Tax=Phytobacter sp. V91 TaxID=3369425 RepID=UPI003F5F1B67
MFLVTNRKLNTAGKGIKAFGLTPNESGPNELRLVSAEKKGDDWAVNIIPDKATDKMKTDAGLNETGKQYFASDYVASILFKKLQTEKRNLLFFVHGYNNDMEEVLERAHRLEALYNVEVLAFSWPAKEGAI